MKIKFAFLSLLIATQSFGAVNSLWLQIEGNTPSKRSSIDRLLTNGTSLVGDGSNLPQVVDIATQAELNALSTVYQQLDSDLTSIAALSTTAFGRGLLDDADASAVRSTLGLVIGTNVQPYNANTSILGSTISFAEMDNLAQNTIIGRYSSGSGAPEALTWGPQFNTTGGTISLVEDYQEADPALDQLVAGTITDNLVFSGSHTITGPFIGPYQAISGTTMDITRSAETYLATGNNTLSFSGAGTTGQVYRLAIKADSSSRSTTIPSAYNPETETTVTSVTTNANSTTYLVFLKESDRWVVSGVPVPTSGSGSFLLQDTPVINAPSFTGVPSLSDGVKWTFNPSSTTAGFNPGSNATDPSSPSNGDMYYQTGVGMRVRSEGAWITVGAGGGGGLSSTDIDTSAEIRAIVGDETGTGALVFANSPVFTGTVTVDTLSVTNLESNNFIFEGSTQDIYETIITVVDPTADNTWTLPNVSDTFVGLTVAQTLTNKTINLANNTLSSTSAQLRTALSDESGTGAAVFAGGDIGAATATTPAENDNDTSVATTAYVQTEIAGLGSGTADSTIDAYKQNVFLWEEFLSGGSFSEVYNGMGELGLKSDYTGSGALVQATSASDINGALGLMNLVTGATSGNATAVYTAGNGMFFNATQAATYTYEIRLKTGSSIAAMTLRTGFGDNQSTDGIDGVFFRYDPATDNSWICVARANSTETTIDSGTDLATNTWYKLRIVVNATGTSAAFYINGTQVTGSPITSGNIPNASNELVGLNTSLVTNESVDKQVTMDYIGLQVQFSSSR